LIFDLILDSAVKEKEMIENRGSVYIIVLALSMMVAVIGLASLFAVRVQRRAAQMTKDCAQARLCARSAIELGLLYVQDPNWRDAWLNGTWLSNQPLGSASFDLEGIDPDDGVLNDMDTDPLVLIGTGKKGLARQKMQVKLVAESGPLTCLGVSLHAGGNLVFNSGGLTSDQIISTNQNATQTGTASITANVEAVGTISLTNHTGTKTEGITPRTMPSINSVFGEYLFHAMNYGTWLYIYDIPKVGGKYALSKKVLSPASNPYGAKITSPLGIYVIECYNEDISIQSMRIVGTLVLFGPGAGTTINGPVNWEPAVPNYPALMVYDGTIALSFDGTALNEKTDKTNFNPTGTPYPYPGGASDSVNDDTYPSLIKGLVYVYGNLNATKNSNIEGVVIVDGTFTSSANPGPNLTYRNTFLNNPPPGFESTPTMKISPLSYKQMVE